MLNQQETRPISVELIDLGQRRQTPSDIEIDHMAKSIEQDGLLVPIGVQRTGENAYRLVHGATRLSAVKKIGWQEIPATILDGTEVDTASAEIVENLTRRHLDKDQRDELTRAYVELRSAQELGSGSKELHDSVSHNSSSAPTSHPKTKVEGAKRGRPPTPGGQAKKDAARLTGRSLRSTQRATTTPRPGNRRSAVKPGNEKVSSFTTVVCELVRLTRGRTAKDFAETGVPPDDLAMAGELLTDLAKLKQAGVSKGKPVERSEGTDSISSEQSAREMMDKHAARENAENDEDDESPGTGPQAGERLRQRDHRGHYDNGAGEMSGNDQTGGPA